MASIVCRNCGAARHRCPETTRLCTVCRLSRDAEAYADVASRCSDCGRDFRRIWRKVTVCGSCNAGRATMRGYCALCEQDDRYLISTQVKVCKECAHDPAQRHRLVKGLRRKIAERRSDLDNAARLAEAERTGNYVLKKSKPRQPLVAAHTDAEVPTI